MALPQPTGLRLNWATLFLAVFLTVCNIVGRELASHQMISWGTFGDINMLFTLVMAQTHKAVRKDMEREDDTPGEGAGG